MNEIKLEVGDRVILNTGPGFKGQLASIGGYGNTELFDIRWDPEWKHESGWYSRWNLNLDLETMPTCTCKCQCNVKHRLQRWHDLRENFAKKQTAPKDDRYV